MTGTARVNRALNGQSKAEFATTNIPIFDARMARAPTPKTFVHSYM
jgi:hypothetical protein